MLNSKFLSRLLPLTVVSVIALAVSCKNGAGPGGEASIKGTVLGKRYVNNCTLLVGEFLAPDEDVYIIYDDDPSYGDRVKTGPDGTFWFKYLRKGKYTIYAYSTTCDVAQKEAVKIQVEITDKKAEVVTDTLVINK
ncbi:MAG: hypothetical protein Fur0041_03950 [Bacteroidia bacterium]